MSAPNPSDAEPVADYKAVEQLLQALVKGLRAIQIYLPNNPIYEKACNNVTNAFEAVWRATDELILEVTDTELRWEEQIVYSEPNRSDSVAWTLYEDGVRSVTMLPGVEEGEVIRFLEVLNRNRSLPPEGADDLLTLLWEQEFDRIRYVTAELGEEDGHTIEGSGGGGGGEPPPAAEVRAEVRHRTTEPQPSRRWPTGQRGATLCNASAGQANGIGAWMVSSGVMAGTSNRAVHRPGASYLKVYPPQGWESRNVEFDVVDRHVGFLSGHVQQAAPVDICRGSGALALGLPLTLDAVGCIRQGVQSHHGDVGPATFTHTVMAVADPLQGVFDSGEFAAFHLRKLRTDLVLNRVQGGVDHVAGCLCLQLLQQTQVTSQRLAQGVSSLDQNLPHVQNCVFAAH